MSFLYSSADHARTVRVRTFPSELTAKREFSDIVTARCIDEDDEIAVARREIKMLDFDAHLFGKLPRVF